jgi:hypothetical protein
VEDWGSSWAEQGNGKNNVVIKTAARDRARHAAVRVGGKNGRMRKEDGSANSGVRQMVQGKRTWSTRQTSLDFPRQGGVEVPQCKKAQRRKAAPTKGG